MNEGAVRGRHLGLLLLQDRDDVLFAEPAALYLRPTPSPADSTQNQPHFRGGRHDISLKNNGFAGEGR